MIFKLSFAGALALAAVAVGAAPASALNAGTAGWRGLSVESAAQKVSRLMPYEGAAPRPQSPVSQRASRERMRVNVQRQRIAALGTQPTRPSRQMDPQFLPQDVPYSGKYKPGTIVIDTESKFLFHVGANGMARRYGVGVGRPGFQWSGRHRVSMKREWPGWTPPAQMRKRQPELPAFMPGGPDNPLGARALYLGSTLYRIHGSNAPWSIGTEVSSGCIRMRNEDVIELYERVKVGTPVVVLR